MEHMTPAAANILIIDDDENISSLLSVNLRSEGYGVDIQSCAADVDLGELDGVSLVIVDAMYQPYSGMDFIFDLKDDPRTEHIGVILYSTIRSERMIIDALDAGADDYITKPFSLRELVARVKYVLRRHVPRHGAAGSAMSFRGLTLDLASRSARLDGKPLPLSKTEFAILALLLRNTDNYVPRTEIHRRVWGADNAGDNERIVDTNISRLRKKLGDLGTCIVSRSGLGYMIS